MSSEDSFKLVIILDWAALKLYNRSVTCRCSAKGEPDRCAFSRKGRAMVHLTSSCSLASSASPNCATACTALPAHCTDCDDTLPCAVTVQLCRKMWSHMLAKIAEAQMEHAKSAAYLPLKLPRPVPNSRGGCTSESDCCERSRLCCKAVKAACR